MKIILHFFFFSLASFNSYGAAAAPTDIATQDLIKQALAIADPNTTDAHGNTLLHFAVISGNLQATKILLQKKVDVSIKNQFGDDALELAKFYEEIAVVDMIETHLLPEKEQETALHYQAETGDCRVKRTSCAIQ